mgnify:CR=1 FL=1
MGQARNWTADEIDYLESNWGTVSIPCICQKLNRSENAIIVRARRLGLGAFLDNGDYVTFNQLRLALGITGGGRYMLTSWIKNRNFPVKNKLCNKNRFRIVYLHDFWKWAYENQAFLDFSRFKKYALGEEPDWVQQKRSRDFQKAITYKNTPWTKQEDDRLKHLLSLQKYSYTEISKMLMRTVGAIQKRCSDLKIKERPVKADNHNLWTEQQINTLSSLIKSGYNYEAIHNQIPDKSVKAIRGFIYRFYVTESLDKVRAYICDGKFGDNIPEKKLYQMNCMTVEERNGAKDNVSMLAYLLLQRAREISPVAEEYKDYWQKDMCMNWSDITGCKSGQSSCDSCTSFSRIKEQYCKRCGATFLSRKESLYCDRCIAQRKKQAQRKWAVMYQRGCGRMMKNCG